jgi:hypothetical protein
VDAELRDSIPEEQQKLSDLENYFRMRMNPHSTHQFQQSIRRDSNTAFAAFCQGHFKRAVIQPERMAEFMDALVRQPREDQPLVVAILPELLCVVTLVYFHMTFFHVFGLSAKHSSCMRGLRSSSYRVRVMSLNSSQR